MEFAEKIDFIMRSINETNRLNYFKSELLKILDAMERQENRLSKAIEDYFDEIEKSVYGWGIEKGKLGTVGEIRTWKDGKRYKKMPDGKWVRVYHTMSRSAEISIARLKGIVGNAQSVEELYKICMANNRRFATEDGYLPILQELTNEAERRQIQIEDTATRIKPLFEPRINDNGVVKENAKEKKLSNIELKRMLRQFYKKKLQGGYVKNLSTGKKIILSRDGLDEWESKSKSREQILSLKCLDFLLRNGKLDHSEAEAKNNRHAKSYDYYTCNCEINGSKYNAWITIRNTDTSDSKYYHHFLENIKIKPFSAISDQSEKTE